MVKKENRAIVYGAAIAAGAAGALLLAKGAAAQPGDVAAELTIGTDPNPSDPGVPVSVAGRLSRQDTGAGVPGETIIIEAARSQTAILWSTVTLAATGADGGYSAQWIPPSGVTYVRARFTGASLP